MGRLAAEALEHKGEHKGKRMLDGPQRPGGHSFSLPVERVAVPDARLARGILLFGASFVGGYPLQRRLPASALSVVWLLGLECNGGSIEWNPTEEQMGWRF